MGLIRKSLRNFICIAGLVGSTFLFETGFRLGAHCYQYNDREYYAKRSELRKSIEEFNRYEYSPTNPPTIYDKLYLEQEKNNLLFLENRGPRLVNPEEDFGYWVSGILGGLFSFSLGCGFT